MRRAGLLLALALPALGGCGTALVNGPSRLTGQDLDAAVALYGPWMEEVVLDGRPTYIWRRNLIGRNGQRYVCELRVQTGFQHYIVSAALQGIPDACKLYAVRYEANTK